MIISGILATISVVRSVADIHTVATSQSSEEVGKALGNLTRRTVMSVCCPVIGDYLEGSEEIVDAADAAFA